MLKRQKDTIQIDLINSWNAVPRTNVNRTIYYSSLYKESACTNPSKEVQNSRSSTGKIEYSTLIGNPRKRKRSEYDEDKKEQKSSEKLLSTCGTSDFKIKHTCASAVKSEEDSAKNSKACFKSNIKSVSDSRYIAGSGVKHCEHYSDKINLKSSTTFQNLNCGKNQNQSSIPKGIGNVSKCDVAPQKYSAQSRLIQSQKKNAVTTLASSFSKPKHTIVELKPKKEFTRVMGHKDSIKNSHFQQNFTNHGQRQIKDLVISHIKSDKKFQNKLKSLIVPSQCRVNRDLVDDYNFSLMDEEMDWEPSEQEVMIEHIKSMRKNMDTADSVSSYFPIASNNQIRRESDNLILIFDTNVFISCLAFIREVRDTYVPGLGLPSIFVPWRVLSELDHLKISNTKQLGRSAIRAISYLNENFSSKHPRVYGQSFDDFCLVKSSECDSPDDEILNMCLHLRKTDKQRRVILITNDKNLESKAIVSTVEAYSKQRFVEDILNRSAVADTVNESSTTDLVPLKHELYPKLKLILKTVLEQVVQTEVKRGFGEHWIQVVTKKPPWSLTDVFECFVKHWRSVFTFTFENNLLLQIKHVKENFLKWDTLAAGKGAIFSDLIQISLKLLKSMGSQISLKMSSDVENMNLVQNINIAISEIESLDKSHKELTLDGCSKKQLPTAHVSNACTSSPQVQDISIVNSSAFDHQQCREEVKALFQIIWDQVKTFCCRITELVSNNGMVSSDIIDQVKSQFPHVLQKLQELIGNVEKIVSLEPEEIAHSRELVVNFTNFLVSLNVFQIEASDMENLSKKIGFFCCDHESRAVLCVLINDLKQFATQMMDGMKFLGFL